jgi:hypothetical protein
LARRKKLALVKIGRAIVSGVPWLAITAAIARRACNDARRCGALDVSVVFGGFLSRAPAICARLARFTLEPRRALTKIIVHEIETCSSVHAGTFRTIVDVCLTFGSHKAFHTGACKCSNFVLTKPIVLAGIAGTVVDVYLALLAFKSSLARTSTVSCGSRSRAASLAIHRASAKTVAQDALGRHIAVFALISLRARAIVIVHQIGTFASIGARISRLAFVQIGATVRT